MSSQEPIDAPSELRTQLADRGIDRDVPVPYYYQIAEVLREVIEDSDVDRGPGEVALPSESELCGMFGVTRGTVRHALEVIEREGLIYREKGRGTFLKRRRVGFDLTKLCSSTEDMRARGWEPGTRVLGVSCVPPRPHIQHGLRIDENQHVWELYRLRLANGEPISLQWSYIPCDLAPRLDECELAGSLYYVLKNKYDHSLVTADQIIRTRVATQTEADLLGIEEGDAILVIERTTFDQRGDPVELLHSIWRGDRYDFELHLATRD
jgi:GntR family transcriptional regulator